MPVRRPAMIRGPALKRVHAAALRSQRRDGKAQPAAGHAGKRGQAAHREADGIGEQGPAACTGRDIAAAQRPRIAHQVGGQIAGCQHERQPAQPPVRGPARGDGQRNVAMAEFLARVPAPQSARLGSVIDEQRAVLDDFARDQRGQLLETRPPARPSSAGREPRGRRPRGPLAGRQPLRRATRRSAWRCSGHARAGGRLPRG